MNEILPLNSTSSNPQMKEWPRQNIKAPTRKEGTKVRPNSHFAV